MEFSRQKYWSGLPFPSPGDLPDPGIEPRSSALQADFLPSDPCQVSVKVLKFSSLEFNIRSLYASSSIPAVLLFLTLFLWHVSVISFSFLHHSTENSFSWLFTSNPFKLSFAHRDLHLSHFSVSAALVLGFQAFEGDLDWAITTTTALNWRLPRFSSLLCVSAVNPGDFVCLLPSSEMLLGIQSSRLCAFLLHCLRLVCSNWGTQLYQHNSRSALTPSFHPRAGGLIQEICLVREQGSQSWRAERNKGSWGDFRDLLGIMREDWSMHRRLYCLAFQKHLSQNTRTSPDQ